MANPVLVDKYLMGTECEVDAICDGEDFLIPGMMEHIERAGIHSGDSISMYPPQSLKQKIKGHHRGLHRPLGPCAERGGPDEHSVRGVQRPGVHHRGQPRSSPPCLTSARSRAFPWWLAVRCMLGEKLRDMGYGTGLYPTGDYCAVKVPVFSFEKLHNVDLSWVPR